MLFVFVAGFIGFFVFDVYRMYSDKIQSGHLIITFSEFKGIFAHGILYCAAGFLGVLTNIDVLTSEATIIPGTWKELDELSGAIFRSFSLGILGPAALKRPTQQEQHGRGPSDGSHIDDTPVSKASFSDYIRYFLMR